VIQAHTHTDDHAIKVDFDATPYLEKATEEDVAKLIECGFGGDYPADWVAQNLAETQPEIAAMFTYLDARNRASRKSIGYEVQVDEEQALAWLSATELLSAFKKRRLSPLDVTEAILERIESLDPVLNAYALVDREGALVAASETEARWAAGNPLGPLDGVPVSIKDIVLTRGLPTRRGSRLIEPDQP